MSYKILIVCSGNYSSISPFVSEQANSLKEQGCTIEFFPVLGKGVFGYLKNLKGLKNKIIKFNPDFVHAHYGLSGLLACFQRIKPVIITYHGSDLNKLKPNLFSIIASRLATANIFVSEMLLKKAMLKRSSRNYVIPCGTDPDKFYPISKAKARSILNLDYNAIYILFTSGFDNRIKNYQLCYETMKQIEEQIILIELKNRTREDVLLLMNAADLLLLTSYSEGSPQVVKEAMMCNCPVIATDVGDLKELTKNMSENFILPFNSFKLSEKVTDYLKDKPNCMSRERILSLGLDMLSTTTKIIGIYSYIYENAPK
ncbi:MAG: glycosyltransferase family 4 protein [Saprospiraceae bacterium]|nr:glycosyltransferase family 4 protein [Saprospiraceae bacterium]